MKNHKYRFKKQILFLYIVLHTGKKGFDIMKK